MGNVLESCSSCGSMDNWGFDERTMERKLEAYYASHPVERPQRQPETPTGPSHRPHALSTTPDSKARTPDAAGTPGSASKGARLLSPISPGSARAGVLGNSGGVMEGTSYDDDEYWDETTRYGGPLTDDETEEHTMRTEGDVSEGSRIWSSTPTPRSDLKVSWDDRLQHERGNSSQHDFSVLHSDFTHESGSRRTGGALASSTSASQHSRHARGGSAVAVAQPEDRDADVRRRMARQSARYLRKSDAKLGSLGKTKG